MLWRVRLVLIENQWVPKILKEIATSNSAAICKNDSASVLFIGKLELLKKICAVCSVKFRYDFRNPETHAYKATE